MKASVCIEMIYTEYPFLDRIKIAKEQGFDAVEFWNWDNKDMPAIKKTANDVGIAIATFQSNRGGTLINPAHRESFVAGIKESLAMGVEMKTKEMFLLTDELGDDRSVKFQFPELSEKEKYQSVLEGMKLIAPLAENAGITIVLEPLNNLVDHAGYWLKNSEVGFELVRKVNSPNIRLLFDIYHQQITEGNLIERLTRNLDAIGHVHVADVPGRHQPGTGEINFPVVLAKLRDAGYKHYVGLEFEPVGPSKEAAAAALKLIKG
ncbi:MAG: TIM barrel protein [Pelolinea sp.]|nr:TIM barrel protein [Pelolinea sp.]